MRIFGYMRRVGRLVRRAIAVGYRLSAVSKSTLWDRRTFCMPEERETMNGFPTTNGFIWLSVVGNHRRSVRGRDLERAPTSKEVRRTYGSVALCYRAGRRDAVFASGR